jgi:tetratricopeptide (TPR) repeat protein
MSMIRPLRRLLLPALLLTTALPAWSQMPSGATVQPLPKANDPAELLAGALRTLAVEPNNLGALVTAGTNALALGDPNAAVGFFGRAQGVAPRDGRVKAGLGSALVQMEKPGEALRMFDEAVRLGIPEAQVARDRGLAYDLRGDPARAQRDYQIVLAQDPSDDGVRRRLALSQGISGNKDAAIATLDPLIRKRDIAGWRAQTFVLAMTGDAKGASNITHIMLPQQADALQPFLERLPQLSAADKARAVHFGEMPSQGRNYTATEMANVGTVPTYAAQSAPKPAPQAVTPAPQPAPTQSAQASDLAMPVPAAAGHYDLPHVAAERNHGQVKPPLRTVGTPVVHGDAARVAAAQPTQTQTPPPQPQPAASQPVQPQTTAPAVTQPAPAPASTFTPAPTQMATQTPPPVRPQPEPIGTVDLPASRPASQPAPQQPTPAPSPAPAATQPQYLPPLPPHEVAQSPVVTSAPAPRPAPKPARTVGTPVVHGDEAKIAEATEKAKAKKAAEDAAPPKSSKAKAPTKLAAEDEADDSKPTKAGAKKGTKLAAADEDGKTAKGRKSRASSDEDSGTAKGGKSAKSSKSGKTEKAEKPVPSRIYVQVAGGANRDDMDKAWTGIKKKAPDLMKGHAPSTVPVRATNRLVVGPFKDQSEAQAFVNKAAGKGVSAFVVTSEKGQKVEKLGGGE